MRTFNARFGAWTLLLSLPGLPFAPIIGTARLATGRWFVGIVMLWAAGVRAAEPTFTNVTATVAPGLPEGSRVAWGDYDSDGRLDFLITGYFYSTNGNAVSYTSTNQLWRNTGSGFTNVTATVAPGLPRFAGPVVWGDYDNDDRLDFFLIGSGIWRNTGNVFTNVTATVAPDLPSGFGGAVAWGDYDNDGRLDFIVTGVTTWSNADWIRVSQVWRNTGNEFTNVTATVAPSLARVSSGSVAWGDFDNDGRLDFLLTGVTRNEQVPNSDDETIREETAQLWRNTGSGFMNVTASAVPGLPAVGSTVAWADYDNDGRLDFFLTGSGYSQLWRNTGSGFTNVTATVAPGLPALSFSSMAWGDYDNDGRLDFLISGYSYNGNANYVSQLWRNTESGFTNVTTTVAPGLPGLADGSVAWADYDNDGRLDFMVTGPLYFVCDVCDHPPRISQLWRNNTAQTSPPPSVITGLPSDVSQTSVALNARINPRAHATTAWFVLGDSTNYGQVTAAQPVGNGNSFSNFSQTISGLSTGVTYYYRAVGSNEQGQVVLGVEQRFLLAGPGVTTSPVGDFRPNTATIKGHVTPNNLPTYGWFEWGLTPAFGQVTPVQFLGNGFDATLSQDLFGLAIGTTFYFRAVASNSLAVAHGAAQSLVMLDAPFVCPGSLSPTNRSHGNSGGGPYSINVRLQCDWVAINTNSWISITSATNGAAGNNSLTYTLARNTDLQGRSGNVTIGGHNLFVTQAGANPDCLSVSGRHIDRGYGAAVGTVYFGAAAHCPWNIVTSSPWITILSATNGVGSGQIVYAIEENPDMQSRSGYVRIGSDGFSITQYGRVYVSLPADQIVALGGTAMFSVTVNTSPLNTLQWQFNGVDLVDGDGISGATTANLVLTGVQYSQGGHYRCAVNESYVSSSATLTVAPTSNALPIDEAVDTDDVYDRFFWKTWSNSRGIWFGQTNTTHDGIDALECSGLAPGEFASVETKSGGPGLLNFWWKSDFASPSDSLLFWIGSYQSAALTNTTDWEQRSFTVPPGDVNLRWTFSNASTGEQSRAWLDQVQFTPCDFRLSPAYNHPFVAINSLAFTGQVTVTAAANCPWHIVNTNSWITILSSVTNHGSGFVTYVVAANPTAASRFGYLIIADLAYSIYQAPGSFTNAGPSLAEALDTAHSLSLSTIGTPAWFGQTIMSRDGADAAQSGPVGDGAAVTVTTAMNQPGTVLFWWKVSSETNKDYLKFFINGVQQTRISGEVDWQLVSYELTSVTNTLKWTYSKNDDEAVGQDRGWLDQVQFIPASATGSCVLAISPISATTSPNSDTGSVTIVAAAGCAWDVVNTNAWITHIASPGESNGFVRYTVSANNSRSPRTGVLFIGSQPFTLTQSGGIPPCSYSLSATAISHGPPAGSATVTVTTQSDCEWSVWNTNTWITITSSLTNVGSGPVTYSVSSNTSSLLRSGQIRIAGQILTVNQSGAPITLAQALDTVGTPLVWSPDSYGWFAQSAVTHDGVDAAQSSAIPGLAVMSVLEATVTGPGTLTFWWKVSSEPIGSYGLRFFLDGLGQAVIDAEADWQQRTATIPAGTHSLKWIYVNDVGGTASNCGWVDQVQFVPTSACPVTLSPGNASYPTNFSTGSFSVTAAADCAWSVFNTNSWISITSGSNGTGNGSVIYTVAANPSAPARSGHLRVAPGPAGTGSGVVAYSLSANNSPNARSGIIRIASRNFILTQTGAPGGCTFSISPGSRMHGYGAASNTVAVTADAGCAWSVSNTNSWVNIVSGTNGTGSGVVAYSLTANNSPNTRSGSVQIAGLNFTLTQDGAPGGCTFSISPGSRTHGFASTSNLMSVTTQNGCAWSVVNTNPWVSIRSSLTNSGSGTVIYTLGLNANSDARSGNLLIGGQLFRLTQQGAGTNAPRLQITGHTGTNATFSVRGEPGKMYVVESSEDLIYWTPISTNAAPSTVTDAAVGNAPQRFYRTVEIP